MQIKTTMRYPLAPTRMTEIKTQKITVDEDMEKFNSHTLLVGMSTAVDVENCLEFPDDPAVPQELKTGTQTKTCTQMFIAALFFFFFFLATLRSLQDLISSTRD